MKVKLLPKEEARSNTSELIVRGAAVLCRNPWNLKQKLYYVLCGMHIYTKESSTVGLFEFVTVK